MTTVYVVKKLGFAEFDHMIKLYNWCEKNFGKPDYYKTTWDADLYDSTDDWVAFKFYDAIMAFWFKERFPEVMTEQQADEAIRLAMKWGR